MNGDIELRGRRRNSRLIIPDVEDLKVVGPIVGYADEPLLPLADACAPLVPIIFNILAYVARALRHTSIIPSDDLTRDESASIFLYTMEWEDEHRSVYSILNETLRTADREQLQPWYKYLKLLLTALVKIPCAPQQTVWRGIRKELRLKFRRGTPVIWWSFSSCTTTLPVLENDLYLGYQGPRTLFSIEAFNAKSVKKHSYFCSEDEMLLLPGTYMEVQSQFNPAPDLYIVHLKQMIPNKILLEPPFEGACLYPKNTALSRRRWYKKKRFIIPFSLLAAMMIVAIILGSVLGSRTTATASGGNCASFIRKDGWDIPDNDILPSPVHEPNYDSCCKQCQATSECTAFIFEPSSERCWPKRSIGSGGNAIGGTVTGYNPNVCGGSVRKDAWDIPGNDILISPETQPDYASCCSRCQATSGCIAFTYSPSSRKCSLKKSKNSGRNSTDDTITGYLVTAFDSKVYYRFTTLWQGDDKSLSIINDGINNNQLILDTTDNNSGQQWKITLIGNGYHRLTTLWRGDGKSLDIVDDDINDAQPILATTSNSSGQYWKITLLDNGYYRLTTLRQGDGKSLDIINDGINNNKPILATTGSFQGQYWKITEL